MRFTFVIGGIVVAVGVILLLQFWPDSSMPLEIAPGGNTAPSSTPESVTGPETPLEAELRAPPAALGGATEALIEEPVVELPSLERSDDFLREQVTGWPIPEAWLQQEDLLSRVAVVVQNAAEARVPRRQLGFLTPSGNYPVITVGDQFYVDPAGYQRYDTFVDYLEAIPAEDLAGLMELVDPLLIHAMAALGDRRPPSQLLAHAMSQVQALPAIDAEVELLRPNVMYTYADPRLEARSEFDKQMMRMGPNNISRLKSYIIDFKEHYFQD